MRRKRLVRAYLIVLAIMLSVISCHSSKGNIEAAFYSGNKKEIKRHLRELQDNETNMTEPGTLLYFAALNDDLRSLSQLLEIGADVNSEGPGGISILSAAILRGASTRLIDLLIENGARIDGSDGEYLPLHAAAGAGDKENVERLLDMGAFAQRTDEAGMTPLHFVDYSSSQSEAICQLLIEAGGDPSRTNNAGVLPIQMAAIAENLDAVKLLGENGNYETEGMLTSLHIAAWKGDRKLAEYLISTGIAVDIGDKIKNTPLHHAVRNRNQAVMELLLEHGADPYKANQIGFTPVDYAVYMDWEAGLDMLESF